MVKMNFDFFLSNYSIAMTSATPATAADVLYAASLAAHTAAHIEVYNHLDKYKSPHPLSKVDYSIDKQITWTGLSLTYLLQIAFPKYKDVLELTFLSLSMGNIYRRMYQACSH
jgi:hypothetical protein